MKCGKRHAQLSDEGQHQCASVMTSRRGTYCSVCSMDDSSNPQAHPFQLGAVLYKVITSNPADARARAVLSHTSQLYYSKQLASCAPGTCVDDEIIHEQARMLQVRPKCGCHRPVQYTFAYADALAVNQRGELGKCQPTERTTVCARVEHGHHRKCN